jgi:hypothetical protein
MVANNARRAAVFCLLLASACGSGGGSTSSSSGSGGGGGGTGGGPVEVTYPFGLFVLESSDSDGVAQTFALGAFQRKLTPGCVVTDMGSCTLTDCTNATMPSLASGGKLTVTGGQAPITLAESQTHVYSFNASSTTWSSGAKLTLKASGDDVPAFATQGQAPGIITVEKPSFDLPITVDRNKDFEVAWKDATDVVQLLLTLNPDRAVTLNCSFDGKAGMGTVPSAILGKIKTNQNDLWGMVVHQANKTVSTAGKWTVELEITQIGKTASGAGSSGEVTLQ